MLTITSTLRCAAIVAASLAAAGEPRRGLREGDNVPVTTMRWVTDKTGKVIDKNTCLAGTYSTRRAISVYARTAKEPQLVELLKQVEAVLAEKPELRGYVLFVEGDQRDEVLKRSLRDWAKEQAFANLDVALAVSDPEKEFGFTKETRVLVVYSDSRQVKYTRDFAAAKLDDAAVKDLGRKLTELTK